LSPSSHDDGLFFYYFYFFCSVVNLKPSEGSFVVRRILYIIRRLLKKSFERFDKLTTKG